MTTSPDPRSPDSDAPDSEPTTFADLGLSERVLRALADVGYETPSAIQAATIPALMAGSDVVGLAQTGTGKTAAFAIPILSKIDLSPAHARRRWCWPRPASWRCRSPRRSAVRRAHPGDQRAADLRRSAYGVQLAGLRRGAQVVVGTPGRVIDHLENAAPSTCRSCDYLVLDEADEMLQMGFAEDVETILADDPGVQAGGAVLGDHAAADPQDHQEVPARPGRGHGQARPRPPATSRSATSRSPTTHKMDALTRILEVEPFEAMIVFVRTKQATEEVAEKLRARGFSAAAINGDIAQAQRERTIGQLKDGSLDILVATDVAARGLDVERISHVLNYDIPHDTESYVHRIGRTGRAGRSGDALLFVSPRERHLLKAIEQATRQPLTEMPLPTVEDVNATRVTKFRDSITEHLAKRDDDHAAAEEHTTFRALLEDYVRDHEVSMVDVAAALAQMAQDGSQFLLPPDPPKTRPPSDHPRRARPARAGGATACQCRWLGPPAAGRVAGARKQRTFGQAPLAAYRINVGKRHKVQPGAIVGAIANEGGLVRADFGHIDIQLDHTIVELPATLPEGTLEALAATRISGKLIGLTPAGDVHPAGKPPRKPRRPSY